MLGRIRLLGYYCQMVTPLSGSRVFARAKQSYNRVYYSSLTHWMKSGVVSLDQVEDLLQRTMDFVPVVHAFCHDGDTQSINFKLFNLWRTVLFKIPQQEKILLRKSAGSIDALLRANIDGLFVMAAAADDDDKKNKAPNEKKSVHEFSSFLDHVTTAIYGWSRVAPDDPNAPEHAENLVRQLQDADFRLSSNVYSALIHCWSRAVNNDVASQRALYWFKVMEEETTVGDPEPWNSLLRIHVRQRRFLNLARNLFEKYASLNDGYTYTLLVEGWMKSGQTEGFYKAEENLQRGLEYCLENKDQTAALQQLVFHYLSSCIQNNNITSAEKVLKQMIFIQEDHPELEVLETKHFVIVMNALATRGEANKVNTLFRNMLLLHEKGNQGLKPRYQVLVIVLSALAKTQKSDVTGQMEALLSMIEQYFLVNIGSSNEVINNHAYNIMLDGYSRIPGVKLRRKRILRLMKRMNRLAERHRNPAILADRFSYAALIRAIVQEGEPGFASTVDNVIRRMESSNQDSVQPDENIYALALDACFKSGDDDALPLARNIFDRIQNRSDVRPDEVLYTILMKIHSSCGDAEGSDEVLSRMIQDFKDGRTNCRPSEKLYVTAMSSWERSGLRDALDKALRLFNEMVSSFEEGNKDCRPSRKTFGQLMVILAKSKSESKRQIGHTLLTLMKQFGEEPDVMLLNWYIRVCATSSKDPTNEHDRRENWNEALATFDSLRASKWGANSHSYNSIFYACDKLLDDQDKRFDYITKIFSKCKEDGLVDRRIVTSLKRILPPEQYYHLTTFDPKGKRVMMKYLPKSWQRNKTSHQ